MIINWHLAYIAFVPAIRLFAESSDRMTECSVNIDLDLKK